MRKPKNTVRSISITVETDNLGTVEFEPDEKDKIGTEGHNYFADEGIVRMCCCSNMRLTIWMVY